MSKQTLGEILNAVRNDQTVEYEDLFYAVQTMESLNTFRHLDLSRALDRPQSKTFWSLYEEAFNREKRALDVTPKHWLGKNNE